MRWLSIIVGIVAAGLTLADTGTVRWTDLPLPSGACPAGTRYVLVSNQSPFEACHCDPPGGPGTWICESGGSGGSGTVGPGTLDALAKFTPDGTHVGDTNETDNGTTFSIGKRLAWSTETPAATTGANDYPLGDFIIHRLSTGALSEANLTGFTNGTAGRTDVLVNLGPHNIYLDHNNSGSAAGNRIFTQTGQQMFIEPGGIAIIQYDAVVSKWRVVEHSDQVFGFGAAGFLAHWTGTRTIATGAAGFESSVGIQMLDSLGNPFNAIEIQNNLDVPGITLNGEIASDLVPDTDLYRSFGSAAKHWYRGWISNILSRNDDLVFYTSNLIGGDQERLRISHGADQATLTFTDTDVDLGGGPMTGVSSLDMTGPLAIDGDADGTPVTITEAAGTLALTSDGAPGFSFDNTAGSNDIVEFKSGGAQVAYITRSGTYHGDVIGNADTATALSNGFVSGASATGSNSHGVVLFGVKTATDASYDQGNEVCAANTPALTCVTTADVLGTPIACGTAHTLIDQWLAYCQ